MTSDDMMDRCRGMEERLPLHATGDTDVEEGLRVEEHIAGCAGCARDLEFYRTVARVASEELTAVPPAPLAMPSGAARPRSAVLRRSAAALLILASGAAAGMLAGRWSVNAVPAAARSGPAGVARASGRGLPLSIFSPEARQVLSDVARSGDDRRR